MDAVLDTFGPPFAGPQVLAEVSPAPLASFVVGWPVMVYSLYFTPLATEHPTMESPHELDHDKPADPCGLAAPDDASGIKSMTNVTTMAPVTEPIGADRPFRIIIGTSVLICDCIRCGLGSHQ